MSDTNPEEAGGADSDARAAHTRRPALDRRQIEMFQEIVIRAHYLSLELRDLCAPSGLAPAQMSLGVAQLLRSWAIAFTRAIEAAERGEGGGNRQANDEAADGRA